MAKEELDRVSKLSLAVAFLILFLIANSVEWRSSGLVMLAMAGFVWLVYSGGKL